MIKKMTESDAKRRVQNKYPDYVIEWCILYKNRYIVMAHPDEGPESMEQGWYPDPYYAVNRLTGYVSRFVPATEKDFGQAFFEAVKARLGFKEV